MDILQEVSDQHFTCSICMDLYTDPKQLPCLHSFCRKCLCTHILKTFGCSGGLSFFCPVCRRECRPKDPDPKKVLTWVDCYPDNFYIKSLLDTIEAQKKEAGAVPLQENLRAIVLEDDTCAKHSKETAILYCVVKKQAVCDLCLKSSLHSECADRHMSPEDARAIVGERLESLKSRLGNLSSRVEKTEECLASRPSELKFRQEELAIELSQFFSDLRANINKIILKKEKEAVEELKNVIKSEVTAISATMDEAQSLDASLKSTGELFTQMLHKRPMGTLSVIGSVESQIAADETTTCKIEAGCVGLNVKINKQEDILSVLEQLPWGSIQVIREVKETGEGHNYCELVSAQNNSEVSIDCPTTARPNALVHRHHQQFLPDNWFTEQRSPLAAAPASITVSECTNSLPGFVPSDANQPLASVPVSLQAVTVNSNQSLPAQASAGPSGSIGGYRITEIHEFNGLRQDDIQNASYVGACPNGKNCLIVLDRWNKKLKVFQIDGRILFFLKFDDPMEPWDITRVSDQTFAVTCPSQCRILEIQMSNSSLRVSRSVATASGYSSLVHLNGSMFAAGVCKPFGSPHVDILDMSSNHQATVVLLLPAKVTYPRTLGLTSDGNLFICDWSQKELAIFKSTDFHQLQRYKGTGREAVLREPVGVTKDRQGNLFILDRKTKKVHILSPSSGTMLSILDLGIQSDPKVVVIIESESRYSASGEVLVVAAGNGRLYIYELVTP